MTISEHLLRYIAENNLSYRKLAAKLGMSYAHLNAIVNKHKQAGPAVKQRIADFLGMPVEELDNPDRRVVQVAVTYCSNGTYLLARLWNDGTITGGYHDLPVGRGEFKI